MKSMKSYYIRSYKELRGALLPVPPTFCGVMSNAALSFCALQRDKPFLYSQFLPMEVDLGPRPSAAMARALNHRWTCHALAATSLQLVGPRPHWTSPYVLCGYVHRGLNLTPSRVMSIAALTSAHRYQSALSD